MKKVVVVVVIVFALSILTKSFLSGDLDRGTFDTLQIGDSKSETFQKLAKMSPVPLISVRPVNHAILDPFSSNFGQNLRLNEGIVVTSPGFQMKLFFEDEKLSDPPEINPKSYSKLFEGKIDEGSDIEGVVTFIRDLSDERKLKVSSTVKFSSRIDPRDVKNDLSGDIGAIIQKHSKFYYRKDFFRTHIVLSFKDDLLDGIQFHRTIFELP